MLYHSLNLSQKKGVYNSIFSIEKENLLERGLNYLWNQTEAEVESQKGKILLIQQWLAINVVVAAGGVFEDGGEKVAAAVLVR